MRGAAGRCIGRRGSARCLGAPSVQVSGLTRRFGEITAVDDTSFYSRGERVERTCEASPEAVWAVVSAIGGANGWYYANWLWSLRGLLDRLVGGAGTRRARRRPAQLRLGDALDFWRVMGVERGRRLTLLAEMKLPGIAILEFEVAPVEEGSRVVTAAHFHPAGAVGLLYWYALWPIHKRIFAGLTEAIVERAMKRARGSSEG